MARVRRRRALPDARAAGGARRSRLRRTAAAARSARRRGSTARSTRCWCARPRCTCARGRSCSTSRRWPRTRTGTMRKLPTTCAPRRGARSRGWATAAGIRWCRPGRRAGRFDDELVEAAAEAVRALARRRARWVCAVPSDRSGDARARLRARGSRRRSSCRSRPMLERAGDRPPQREMANSAQQVANVRGAFAVARRAAGRPVPARRRRALQRLDARDARRPAAPPRRARGLSAGARDRVLATGRGA